MNQSLPDQLLEASESRPFLTHEMGNFSTDSLHMRRGHTPDLYSRSFCLRVRGQASTLVNISSNLDASSARDLDWSGGTSMARPRNLTPLGAYGTCWLLRERHGPIFFPVDACRPKHAHFGNVTFIPDHWSHKAIISNRC